jgi:hypothetical protein
VAAKKAAAKKTTTSTRTATAKAESTAKETVSEITKVAQETLRSNSKWGTGRERDQALRLAGHDPAEVQRERVRLQREPSESE